MDASSSSSYWLSKIEEAGWYDIPDILKDSPECVRNNRNILLASVQKNGYALEYASPSLQNDKQVVMAAVKNRPNAIKYAHEQKKRDPDILVAASMYDENYDAMRKQHPYAKKIAMSTRFSLNPTSNSQSNKLTQLLKKSNFYQEGDFLVYAPNAFNKQTCDPQWTRFDWPCRGTVDTCRYENKLTDDGHPTDDCCWRYSFRSQLQEAKDTGGFMLQVVETGTRVGMAKDATPGLGQTIELDMANTMGTKVFQVYRPETIKGYEWRFEDRHIDRITREISSWYDDNRNDMSVTVIRQHV
mmetsp:Transcript_6533/g.11425  ORF Transcript_6533/g.11425 Transcript_6533/m.11425 type:complete len:299 (-) Transcript_6533:79-975(-)|eukprot:CAMPEP_0197441414 /NCGR_PEP_ID=MMETSP1175-20131217/7684_1 /TAXON_ID=1003142 /ORGANISM="Triceratium dubium, Strain CCMP147" /LENGTH=298 /DNA_ID=CAMNT_0042971679 /DNA_START=321 /DNA_END=1217 /DNA_ORIENTATION=-